MKLLNRSINLIIILLIIVNIIYITFCIFEPLMYNENSSGKMEINTKTCFEISQCINKYIDYYLNADTENIRKSNTIYNSANDDKYIDISNKIKKEYNFIVLSNVQRCFDNIYIVEYSCNTDYNEHILDEPIIHKIILKIKGNKMKIFYDSLIFE